MPEPKRPRRKPFRRALVRRVLEDAVRYLTDKGQPVRVFVVFLSFKKALSLHPQIA